MTSRRLSLPALAALAALTVLCTSGCAPDVPSGEGPALVTVTKTPAVPEQTVPAGKVTRLTQAVADGIDWEDTLTQMWVPAGTNVSAGADTSAGSGWVYVDVPAELEVVADVLARRQVQEYPDTVVTRVLDPDGVVMTRTTSGVGYTMSATSDPQAPDQTVVMVRWDAAVSVN